MSPPAKRRWIVLARLACLVLACGLAPASAHADRTVVVLFRGFGATPGSSGMDDLEASLQAAFGGDPARPFSSRVFDWPDAALAFDYIAGFEDRGCLIVGGHSFGGNTAVEMATDLLAPASLAVDLLVQFDSVGANDGALPPNVFRGFNFHQVSTGLFEPQGESFVEGAINVQVEAEYGVADSVITHTSIDEPLFEFDAASYASIFGAQPDLYARIEDEVLALCGVPVPVLGAWGGLALVSVLALTGRRRVVQAGWRGREPELRRATSGQRPGERATPSAGPSVPTRPMPARRR